MSDKAKTVVVRIQGQEYRIEGESDPARMRRVAGYVDRKMEELSQAVGRGPAGRMAVLAALNIADELFGEREAQATGDRDLEKRLSMLADKLESELL